MTAQTLRIGLTATGGDMVVSALSLRQNNQLKFHITTFNSQHSEIIDRIADNFYTVPDGSSPNTPAIIECVKKNGIQVLMPWSDEEAIALSEAKEKFERIDARCL